VLADIIFDIEEEKKHYSFEQIATIITEFSEYLKNETKNLLRQELLKEIYKEKEDLHITIRKCREILEKNPEDPVANTQLGMTYLVKNKVNMAVRQFRKALEYFPDYREALFYLGFSFYLQDKPDLAQEYLNRTEDDNNIIKLCIMGDIYYSLEEIDMAIECFQRVMEIDGNFLFVHINLASIYTLEGNLEQAIELYRKALQEKPLSLIISINLAFNLYLVGELKESLDITKKILDKETLPITLFSYGFFLFQEDRFDEAIEYYKKAIEIEENHFFYNSLGFLYFSRNDIKNAVENYIKSLKCKPDYIPAHLNLGFAYEIQGEPDRAMEEYRLVLSAESDNSMLYYNSGTVMRLKGEFDEAHEYYTKAISIEPKLALAHAGLGITYLDKWIQSGKTDKNLLLLCQENIHMALNIEPRLLNARLALGSLYLERDNPLEALRHFEALLKISSNSYPAKAKIHKTYLSLADKSFDGNKPEAAIQYAEKALQIESEEEKNTGKPVISFYTELKGAKEKLTDFFEKLGDIYYKKGMTNKALEQYKRALEFTSKSPLLHVKAGKIHSVKKEYEEAEKHYKIALRLDFSFNLAYFNLGNLYRDRGEDIQALECFQKYIELSPEGQHTEECNKNIKELYPRLQAVRDEKRTKKIFLQQNIINWNLIAEEYQRRNTISTYDVHYGPGCPGEKELKLLGYTGGKSILELGCGGGQNAIALARQGAKVTGVDFSEEQLRYARNLSQKENVSVDFINKNIENPGFFEESKFDILLSSLTFSYIENIAKVFSNVRKIIKEGGLFVFSMEHPLILNTSEENYLKFRGSTYPFLKEYFKTGEEEKKWKTDKIEAKLVVYKRKLEDIINPLISSGFRITKILEPPVYDPENTTPEEMKAIPFIPVSGEITIKMLPSILIISARAYGSL